MSKEVVDTENKPKRRRKSAKETSVTENKPKRRRKSAKETSVTENKPKRRGRPAKKQPALKVVEGGKNKKSKRGEFDESAFYKKYSHVVKGSVQKVEKNTIVDGVKAVHGRVCKIKCKESGELRTINVQDAHQVFYSVTVQKKRVRQRASVKRRNKKAAKQA